MNGILDPSGGWARTAVGSGLERGGQGDGIVPPRLAGPCGAGPSACAGTLGPVERVCARPALPASGGSGLPPAPDGDHPRVPDRVPGPDDLAR